MLEGLHRVKCEADGQQLSLDVHQARMTRLREKIYHYLHIMWAGPHYQAAVPLKGLY